MCHCTDTRNTQWEDPRLQSPAITGPVSISLSQKDRMYLNLRLSPPLQLYWTLCLQFLCTTRTNFVLCTNTLPPPHLAYQHPCFSLLDHLRYCCMSMATLLQTPESYRCTNPHIRSPLAVWKALCTCADDLLSVQAVPYSREFKQKYDYFRKKLKKPVRIFPLLNGFLGFVFWGEWWIWPWYN